MAEDDVHGDDGMTDSEEPRARRRANRTAAESLGIPPAIGRRSREGAEDGGAEPVDQAARAPAERRKRGAEADARRRPEAAEEEIEKARAEARENADRYVRLAAELDNLRKRYRQDQANQLQYANSELIGKLLPILDNFYRAVEHAPGSDDGDVPQEWVLGLTMVLRQFEDMLAAEGVTAIDAVGKDFDPSLHQAVLAEPSDEHEEGKVIGEMQRGYMLHDRVLRPSLVKVARNG